MKTIWISCRQYKQKTYFPSVQFLLSYSFHQLVSSDRSSSHDVLLYTQQGKALVDIFNLQFMSLSQTFLGISGGLLGDDWWYLGNIWGIKWGYNENISQILGISSKYLGDIWEISWETLGNILEQAGTTCGASSQADLTQNLVLKSNQIKCFKRNFFKHQVSLTCQ